MTFKDYKPVLNFEDKKRICNQIENANHSVLEQIYKTIIEENSDLPIKKTKKGILFSFNKLNSSSLSKIIEILEKEEIKKTETPDSINLSDNSMFKHKKHISSQDKELVFYLLEKHKKAQNLPPKAEVKKKPIRKEKQKNQKVIKDSKSEDSIDLYIKNTSKQKLNKNIISKTSITTIKKDQFDSDSSDWESSCSDSSYIEDSNSGSNSDSCYTEDSNSDSNPDSNSDSEDSNSDSESTNQNSLYSEESNFTQNSDSETEELQDSDYQGSDCSDKC